jgi:hydrogenase-1 operon protein HyaF
MPTARAVREAEPKSDSRGHPMSEFLIPVRVIGPGSQPVDADALQCLEVPREVNVFRMPAVPDRADALALVEARDELAAFLRELESWDPVAAAQGPRRDLAVMSASALAIANQMLGEGEVSIRIDGARMFRIQESVFTGVWRVCESAADGTLVADWLEAAALPGVVVEAARAAALPRLAPVAIPAGAMNSPALINEIGAQMRSPRPDGRAHVVNLTLFPLTPDDHRVLAATLPVGPVALISRGFGNCRITSTLARDVWRVQYFNSMNTLILDTIEVVPAPEAALAAAEDLVDSRERLTELIAWMSESCAPSAG